MNVLGLDIGGANIKLSDADGNTASVPFPMWKQHQTLCSALQNLSLPEQTRPDLIALTMTAELADCFRTKAEGVEFVISAAEQAFPDRPVRIWMTSGEFAEPNDARELPELVAAANWHALATWAARAVPDGPAVLIDVGSTTSDIIPLLDGLPVPQGRNDRDRLLSGELLYTGALRTPICAVVQQVPLRGGLCPVAAELFATTADAGVITGLISEDESNTDTADGRPLTREHSAGRIAHMVCCDATELESAEISEIAEFVLTAQLNQLTAAFEQVLQHLSQTLIRSDQRSIDIEKPVLLLSGSGAATAKRAAEAMGTDRFSELMYLPDMFRKPVSESACAFAVARLAHNLCADDLLETTTIA